MQITRMMVSPDKYDIKCPYSMEAEFIVVHNTANDASAMSEVSYMIGNNNKVSFHAAVDGYRVVEGIPFDRNTWNAGDGRILNLVERILMRRRNWQLNILLIY